MRSPVPPEVQTELRRVVERWHQLPLDYALSRMPLPLGLAQTFADRVARAQAGLPATVPDLGPAVVMDELTVMVFDLFDKVPGVDPAAVADELSGIRQQL